jgi:hyperosmotically inducible protein
MKRIVLASALIAVTALAAGCNRPGTTAYNNSGTSASTPPASSTTTTATTSDTSSPSTSTTAATTTAPADTSTSTSSSSGGNVVTDTVTTGKVKAAIAADSGLKDADIQVKTNGGMVVLTGTVKSPDQITIATNLAQQQAGAGKVDTQVVVK